MANLQFLCFILCENLSLTTRRLILLWLGDEWHPGHSVFSEQGRMGSVRRSWGRVFWSTSVLCRPWGQRGWTVVLVVLAPWTSPWTPSQQMKDLSCLCAGSIQQHFWNQTLLYVCIVLASKLGHFLKSEQGNLANPDNTGHLISLCVQPTASPNFTKPVMWIVCERGGGYKHAQSFRVDVYKPSFLQHKILSLERLRDVFLASD